MENCIYNSENLVFCKFTSTSNCDRARHRHEIFENGTKLTGEHFFHFCIRLHNAHR